jgi:hypothetical protein
MLEPHGSRRYHTGQAGPTSRRQREEGETMRRIITILLPAGGVLLGIGAAHAQNYPLLDRLADKVVQKYQTSSCQQLQQQKMQPPNGQREAMEQRVVQMLHQDPQMRQAFINRVAAPIANKLFECGMIP